MRTVGSEDHKNPTVGESYYFLKCAQKSEAQDLTRYVNILYVLFKHVIIKQIESSHTHCSDIYN